MPFEPGEVVGDYQISGLLGAGGMGSVYRVRNLITDREEALKILLQDLAAHPDLADRFGREIRIQASLEHPNIAQLRTALRVNNQLVMIMELVPGETLEQRIALGALDAASAAAITTQTLSALEYAHQRGIIHRDIKPANIMVTPAGIVKVMDFGIAASALGRRTTRTGLAVGSLHYMSPEQIRALPVDPRSDLYSLGITFYQMVTGRRPFDGMSDFEVMQAHLECEPPPPSTFPAIILRAMARRPEDRFQSAAEFRDALTRIPQREYERPPVPESAAPQNTDAWDTRIFHETYKSFDAPRGTGAVSESEPRASAPVPPRAPDFGDTNPSGWDPVMLERVRRELAAYVGPVARVLVSRAAKNTRGIKELYQALADEILSADDRRKFLANRPQL